MKKNFAKEISESPRAGKKWGSNKRSKEVLLDEDLSDKHEPMSMGRGSKSSTIKYGPLNRFLRKQVGRLWDEIYSEIRQNFQKSTQKNQEVLDSLAYNVELHVQYFEEDGEKIPYTSTGHRIMSWGNHPTFFVCPETGRLKQAKHQSFKHKKSAPKDFREIDGKSYKEKDGIWYEVVLEPTPSWQNRWQREVAHDVLYNKPLSKVNFYNSKTGRYEQPYGREAYCVQKRQLNKKEIKKLKLREQE